MIRTVRAATISANSTSTAPTIRPVIARSPSFADERGRAPDLDDLHARARLDDLVIHEGARRPHLAVDLHAADALVVGDPLEHHRGPPDQRGGAGADLRRRAHVAPRD